ncbi:MAG: FliM/FliN family flagellar motor switch protein [Bryobacteraceae bacterium]
MAPTEVISHLADIPIEVDVELDHRIMSIREILALDVGAVVKMRRSAGENIDILVGGALVGFGEIVIIEDSVGVRITDFSEEL